MNEKLKKEIEDCTYGRPVTHGDYVRLSKVIAEKTNEYVSPTTLKRFWGYLHDYNSPSRFTLNVLSRFLGYSDYDHFIRGEKSDDSSGFFVCTYTTETLTIGDRLELTWRPNRRIIIRYQGEQMFEVVKSYNAKITTGDTFSVSFFIEGEPVTFTKVTHKGKYPLIYTAGRQTGIHIKPVEEET